MASGGGGIAGNHFPARRLGKRQGNRAGEWIQVYQKEQERRFHAVLAPRMQGFTDSQRSSYVAGTRHPPNSPFTLCDPSKTLNGYLMMEVGHVSDPVDLCVLDVTGYGLTEIKPDEFKHFSNLICINAGDNSLEFEQFGDLPNLTELSLPLNNLSNIVLESHKFNSLKVLDLSCNCLDVQVLADLGRLPSLVKLDVSGNDFRLLPPSMIHPIVETQKKNTLNEKTVVSHRFSKLQELHLSNNVLSDASTFALLASFQRLEKLYLDGNSFQSVPQLRLFVPSAPLNPLSPPSHEVSASPELCSSNQRVLAQSPPFAFSPTETLSLGTRMGSGDFIASQDPRLQPQAAKAAAVVAANGNRDQILQPVPAESPSTRSNPNNSIAEQSSATQMAAVARTDTQQQSAQAGNQNEATAGELPCDQVPDSHDQATNTMGKSYGSQGILGDQAVPSAEDAAIIHAQQGAAESDDKYAASESDSREAAMQSHEETKALPDSSEIKTPTGHPLPQQGQSTSQDSSGVVDTQEESAACEGHTNEDSTHTADTGDTSDLDKLLERFTPASGNKKPLSAAEGTAEDESPANLTLDIPSTPSGTASDGLNEYSNTGNEDTSASPGTASSPPEANQVERSGKEAAGKYLDVPALDFPSSNTTEYSSEPVQSLPDKSIVQRLGEAVQPSPTEEVFPFPSLQLIDLSGNKIADQECLLHLNQWPALKHLIVQGNPFVAKTRDCSGVLFEELSKKRGVTIQRSEESSKALPSSRRLAVQQTVDQYVAVDTKDRIPAIPRRPVEERIASERALSIEYEPSPPLPLLEEMESPSISPTRSVQRLPSRPRTYPQEPNPRETSRSYSPQLPVPLQRGKTGTAVDGLPRRPITIVPGERMFAETQHAQRDLRSSQTAATVDNVDPEASVSRAQGPTHGFGRQHSRDISGVFLTQVNEDASLGTFHADLYTMKEEDNLSRLRADGLLPSAENKLETGCMALMPWDTVSDIDRREAPVPLERRAMKKQPKLAVNHRKAAHPHKAPVQQYAPLSIDAESYGLLADAQEDPTFHIPTNLAGCTRKLGMLLESSLPSKRLVHATKLSKPKQIRQEPAAKPALHNGGQLMTKLLKSVRDSSMVTESKLKDAKATGTITSREGKKALRRIERQFERVKRESFEAALHYAKKDAVEDNVPAEDKPEDTPRRLSRSEESRRRVRRIMSARSSSNSSRTPKLPPLTPNSSLVGSSPS